MKTILTIAITALLATSLLAAEPLYTRRGEAGPIPEDIGGSTWCEWQTMGPFVVSPPKPSRPQNSRSLNNS